MIIKILEECWQPLNSFIDAYGNISPQSFVEVNFADMMAVALSDVNQNLGDKAFHKFLITVVLASHHLNDERH